MSHHHRGRCDGDWDRDHFGLQCSVHKSDDVGGKSDTVVAVVVPVMGAGHGGECANGGNCDDESDLGVSHFLILSFFFARRCVALVLTI